MSRRPSHPPYPIVLVIDNLEYGGAQRQVVELANHIDPSRFDVHICSLSDYVPLADRLVDRERRLHIIAKKWKYDGSVIPRLATLLNQLKADIVHGYLFASEIASRLAGRLARTSLIFGSERNTDYPLKRRQLVAYRLTRGCMDLLVANSKAGAQFDCRMFGYRPTQCRVVHNGVDTQRFRPHDEQELRRELGIGEAESVIGMFASFKKQKNHPLFFGAARRVLQRFPQTRLLLVGDELYGGMYGSDEYKRNVERLVDELDLRAQCLFLGNRDDVDRLYSVCDLTVLPSFFEGTPNVALESMACGVPVIATRVSDNAQVIPDGRVGYVVPLGDEAALSQRICRLLEDNALRRQMGQEARAWVEAEFSIARLVEKTARVYQDALDSLDAAGDGGGKSGAAVCPTKHHSDSAPVTGTEPIH
jgi:glycosyltransferase involved in cell wall biosynthesis